MIEPANTSRPLKAVPQVGHTGSLEDVAWRPLGGSEGAEPGRGGGILASAADDGTIRLWDTDAATLVGVLEEPRTPVLVIAWHPGGQEIAAAGWDGVVTLWDAVSGRLRRSFTGHSARISGLAWDPSGELLATASGDHTARLWHAGSRETRLVLEHDKAVTGVAWDPRGGRLATASDGRIHVWDAVSGKTTHVLESIDVYDFAWAPDGRRIASSYWKSGLLPDRHPVGDRPFKGVTIWDVETASVLGTLEADADGAWRAAWEPSGEKIAVCGFRTTKIWEADERRLWGLLESCGVSSVAWDPAGRRIAAEGDRSVRVWDAASGQQIRDFECLRDLASRVAWAPDGRTLGMAFDNVVEIRDAVTGRLAKTLRGHEKAIRELAWAPSGERLATVCWDDVVKTWDVRSGHCLMEVEDYVFDVDSLVWGVESRIAASSEDGIRIWDAATGAVLSAVEGNSSEAWYRGLALSPDGEVLAATREFLYVALWDAASGRHLRDLEGHTETIRGLAWDPTGKRLVSAGEDKTVRTWDAATGEPLNVMEGHAATIRSVAWDPAGERIASADDHMTVRVWDAASGQHLHTLPGFQEATVSFPAPGRLAICGAAEAGLVDVWDLDGTGGASEARRRIRIHASRRLAGLVTTDDGFVDGPPETLAHVRFADGWKLYDLEEVPERHSPERVRQAWEC